ncbi:hypothetical protein IFM89_029545 [Coptis chinensis]|uniref:Uncharacterized protein n=1 Tax=Coptis chinensis TaxID=261450 RepID=A0A835LFH2_9MAGN|nr:hypothetical protein IFM89_029545 [Coptis chinensis]
MGVNVDSYFGFLNLNGDCASGCRRYQLGTNSDQKIDIIDSCSQMMLQLHDVYDPNKANFLAEGGFGSVHRGVLPDG